MKTWLLFSVLLLLASISFAVVFLGELSPERTAKYAVAIALLIGTASLLATLLVSVFSSREAAKCFLTNLALLLFMTNLLLVASEYGLRYFYRDVTTSGSSQPYFEKKWRKNIRMNRFGFRERDFQLEKAANCYRIAIVGDSLTFGKGIAEEDRFSNLLEQRLNTENKGRDFSYEVLNFGRPGANTLDEIEILHEFVLPAKPDFILLQWYKNDVIDLATRKSLEKMESSWLGHKLKQAYRRMVNNSLLFSIVNTQLNRLEQKVAYRFGDQQPTRYDEESIWTLFGDPDSVASAKARKALLEFIGTAKRNRIPVGMVLFTDSYFRPSSQLDYLLERVVKECDREQITCIDMRGPLAPHQGSTKLWASKLDPHPSAFANRITVDVIIRAFSFQVDLDKSATANLLSK